MGRMDRVRFMGSFVFYVFFYLLFPYNALGRRILYTLEQKTSLVTRPSETGRRLLGIRWARVDISSLRHRSFPPIKIENWVIQLRPLSLLSGRISVTSHGTVMGGSFHANLVMERKGHQGRGEWDNVRIDRFPLLMMEKASFWGIASGKVLWRAAGQRLDGEASFELRNGRIEDALLAGLAVPVLDLGTIKGQLTVQDERIDVEEITVAGRDLKGKLTGSVGLENPLSRSRVRCRLEIGVAESLLNRYPVLKALFGNEQGKRKPLVMVIGGTPEAPRVSLTR